MKQLFSERNALRDIKIKTDLIDQEKYRMLIQCCDKYYDNLAADFPDRYSYDDSIHSVNNRDLIRELKYRIPRFHADNYWQGTPKRKLGQSRKDPYALLDYIEFMALHIKTIVSQHEDVCFRGDFVFDESSDAAFVDFREEINRIFDLTGLTYTLTANKQIERITEADDFIRQELRVIDQISENELRSLIFKAISLYKNPKPEIHQLASEKIWDALERLKTIYVTTDIDKKESVTRLISDLSNNNEHYINLFNTEFKALTDIGNEYRIRHHEISKIDIIDDAYYDYFFNRCFALITLALKYIKE